MNMIASELSPAEQTPELNPQQPLVPSPHQTQKWPFITLSALLVVATSAAAYFYFFPRQITQTNTVLATPTPTPVAFVTPTPAATPNSTTSWETYLSETKNYLIKYPPTWNIDTSKAELDLDARLTIFKNEYKITILWPSAFGPGICVFDDQDRTNAPDMASYCEGKYKQFLSNNDQETHRRLVSPNKYLEWPVYTLYNEHFTTAPPIKYQAPVNYDPEQIEIMDQIISTYQVNEQTSPSVDATNWQTYTDQYFNYQIKYDDGWKLRKTYGPDVDKLAPTDIVSGVDLHFYEGDYFHANVGINLLESKGEKDINNWITKYDLNYPKEAAVKQVSFNGVDANEYTYQTGNSRVSKVLYFIKNDYAYKIWFWGDNQDYFNKTKSLVETFLAE